MKSRYPFHGARHPHRWGWAIGALALMAVFGGEPTNLMISDAQAVPCIDPVELIVPSGDSAIIQSPPGFLMRILPYEMPSGFWFSGTASVVDERQTQGWGRGLLLDHLGAAFDIGPLECVYIRFRCVGGDCYLKVNGQVRYFKSPLEIHGTTLGGVRVYVYPSREWAEGYLILSGRMERFADSFGNWASLIIGGKALVIGSICVGR